LEVEVVEGGNGEGVKKVERGEGEREGVWEGNRRRRWGVEAEAGGERNGRRGQSGGVARGGKKAGVGGGGDGWERGCEREGVGGGRAEGGRVRGGEGRVWMVADGGEGGVERRGGCERGEGGVEGEEEKGGIK